MDPLNLEKALMVTGILGTMYIYIYTHTIYTYTVYILCVYVNIKNIYIYRKYLYFKDAYSSSKVSKQLFISD